MWPLQALHTDAATAIAWGRTDGLERYEQCICCAGVGSPSLHNDAAVVLGSSLKLPCRG